MNQKTLQSLILIFSLILVALLFLDIKPLPQIFCVVVAVLGTALRWLLPERWGRMVAGLMIVASLIAAIVFVTAWMALWLVPAMTPDGHRVMPIGQLVFGIGSGLLIAGVISVVYLRKWRVADQIERAYLLCLAVGLPVIYLIDQAM